MQIKKYKLLKKIGEGGCSEVFLVEDQVLHKVWLMKKIWKTEQENQERSTEEKEIELLKNLSHPSIPRVVEYFFDKKANYYILDYIQGENLRTVMNEGKITVKLIERWMMELMEILFYLHNRQPAIFYGDLKPENIIVGNHGKISLVDFGASGKVTEVRTKSYGTKGYAAPEQYVGKSGKVYLDVRSDIYSLGQVFFELFTGDLYVEGKSDFQKVPREYRMFLKKSLEAKKEKRYQCIKTMQQDLKRLVERERKRKLREKVKILIFPMLALVIACMSIFFRSGQKVALSETKDKYEAMVGQATQFRVEGKYEEALSLLYDCMFQYPKEEKAYIEFFTLACRELRKESIDYIAEEILKNAEGDILYQEEVAYAIGTYYLTQQKYQKAFTYYTRISDLKEGSQAYCLKEITGCLLNSDLRLSELRKILLDFQQVTIETSNSLEQMLQFQIMNQVILTYFMEDAEMLEIVEDNCEWLISQCDESLDDKELFLYYEQLGNARKELGKLCKANEKEKKMLYFEEAVSTYFKAIQHCEDSVYGMEGKLCDIGKLYHAMKEYDKENEIYSQGIYILGENANDIYCAFLNSLIEQYQENVESSIKEKIQEVIETGNKLNLSEKNQRWSMLIQTAKERGIYEEKQ